MNSEPTIWIEAARQLLILATAFGLAISSSQQAAIIGAVGAIVMVGSAFLAFINRNKVYATDTTQAIANRAAATGNTDIGTPPDGPAG